jgi:hypothetical protein
LTRLFPAGSFSSTTSWCTTNDAQPPFAAWYLLGSIFDNPNAVCLTPTYVEHALRQAGFQIDATEMMLPGFTMLTKARKPG